MYFYNGLKFYYKYRIFVRNVIIVLYMKVTKEYIIEKAFELYLIKGYSGVSITVIQEYLNIGRATMYYYFKNKESLFKEVIKIYYIDWMHNEYKGVTDSVTMPELVEKYADMEIRFKTRIRNITNDSNVTASNFTAILIYAFTHFQEFRDNLYDLKKIKNQFWRLAVSNSIKAGEISVDSDVEMVAMIFSNITDETYEGRMKETETNGIMVSQYRESCKFLLEKLK